MNLRTGPLLVLFAALLVRLIMPSARPMHADEAILASITDTVRQNFAWRYDATDYHGPVLPVLAAAFPAPISEASLRAVPALAGAVLALIVASTNSTPAGLLIALSPAMVYWSRFYIPEMLLALLSAAWIFALTRAHGTRGWAGAGVLAGLMLAAKETAVLAFAAALLAWLIARRPAPPLKHLAICLSSAALLSAALLTSGFTHWSELARLPQALSARAVFLGHQHPVWWYFSVLRWELLAIPLAALAWKRDRFLAGYAFILTVLYCLIPYKTPWCSVQFWWPILILAGQTPKLAYPLAAVFALVAIPVSLLYPASPSNPYAYAQTLPEALRVPQRLVELAGDQHKLQFFSTQNLWPIPWYLRTIKQQEWRRGIDFNAVPAPIVVVTPELEPKLAEWLYERRPPGQRDLYMRVFNEPVFLRPGVEVRVYCVKALYDAGETR